MTEFEKFKTKLAPSNGARSRQFHKRFRSSLKVVALTDRKFKLSLVGFAGDLIAPKVIYHFRSDDTSTKTIIPNLYGIIVAIILPLIFSAIGNYTLEWSIYLFLIAIGFQIILAPVALLIIRARVRKELYES